VIHFVCCFSLLWNTVLDQQLTSLKVTVADIGIVIVIESFIVHHL